MRARRAGPVRAALLLAAGIPVLGGACSRNEGSAPEFAESTESAAFPGSPESPESLGAQPSVAASTPVESSAPDLSARVAELEALLAASRAELARIESELGDEKARRAERELAWYEFTRSVSALGLDAGELGSGFEPQAEPDAATELTATDAASMDTPPAPPFPPAEPTPEEQAWRQGAEIGRRLSAMLAVHGAHGLDLLEAGRLHVPPTAEAAELGQRWIGPVIFRLLDGRGRLAGSLAAERLHLELARAARTVTIVLEGGHESAGGVRSELEAGGRRIELTAADPAAWLAALPELFPADAARVELDDGLWDVARVERELGTLLERASPAGASTRYRLHHAGGVVGDALVDVALVVLSTDGESDRWLFADRMEIALDAGGVALVLEGGAAVRGASRAPFLDGRLRLVLPAADPAEWRAARLPGLALGDHMPVPPAGG